MTGRLLSAFYLALVTSHLEVAANCRSALVYRAPKRIAIQCRAPAVIEARHDASTPGVDIDEMLGHAGVGDQEHFKTATAGMAVAARNPSVVRSSRSRSLSGRSNRDHRHVAFCAQSSSATTRALTTGVRSPITAVNRPHLQRRRALPRHRIRVVRGPEQGSLRHRAPRREAFPSGCHDR